jgi:hypothetical protein
MKQKRLSLFLLAGAVLMSLTGCLTADSRLNKAKTTISGTVNWQISDAEGKLLVDKESAVQNGSLENFPSVANITIGRLPQFEYVSILRLDEDLINISLTFIGDTDDGYSFYEKGEGYVGIHFGAVLQQGDERVYYESSEKHLSKVIVEPHDNIKVTSTLEHSFYSYITGVTFNKTCRYTLEPFQEGYEPIVLEIGEGSYFSMDS